MPAFVISPWVRGIGVRPRGDPAVQFDHTSILKTIARRFIVGTAAVPGRALRGRGRPLSAVLATEARPGPFRPFIPYNLLFGASGLLLDVQGGEPASALPLVQSAASGAPEQEFAIEDAGGGFVYLRSRLTNRYATVREPTAAGASPTVFQDVKYPLAPGQPPERRPELQRWRLTSTAIDIIHAGDHHVSSQAHPDKQLQPANPSVPGSPVILGASAGGVFGLGHNVWKITSPLLPHDQVNHPHP